MKRKVLSIWLTLCMLVTLAPTNFVAKAEVPKTTLTVDVTDTTNQPTVCLQNLDTAATITVDWGDGTTSTSTGVAAVKLKKEAAYASNGEYTIKITSNSEKDVAYVIGSGSKSIFNNWYDDYSNLLTKAVLSSQATIGACSFFDNEKLTELDVSAIDTSQVTDMNNAFGYCSILPSLNVSNFNTSQVTNMRGMFTNCPKLSSINVSNFNTSKVTNMNCMFNNSGITTIDLSKFDTSQVTDIYSIFYSCSHLTSVNLSSFDTSKVTDMRNMFEYCNALSSLDLSNFDTSKVTDMRNMFEYCKKLAEITLGEKFSFKGDGTLADNKKAVLPTPNADKITGADGNWYNKATAASYAPADVPDKVVATYMAINPKGVKNIGVKTAPSKVSYVEGNSFDPSGLVVTLTYNNGTTEDVAYSEDNKADFSFDKTVLATTDTKVVVTYGGKTANQAITVTAKELASIAVKTEPSKVSYLEGNSFDPSGLELTLTYNNDTTEDVTYSEANKADFSFDKTVLATTDTKVAVTYGGKTADQAISVAEKELVDIEITKMPTKTNYKAFEVLDTDGMVVTANYNDGTSKDITEYVVSYENDNTAFRYGNTKAMVNYGQSTKEVAVTVEKADPSYTIPSGLISVYGNTLADVTLPDRFAFQNSLDTKVGNAGRNTFKITYTPEDTDNYNTISDIVVTIIVGPKVAALTWSNAENLVYDKTAKKVTASVANLEDGDECIVTVTGGNATNTGNYTAEATTLSNKNYLLSEEDSVNKKAYTILQNHNDIAVQTAPTVSSVYMSAKLSDTTITPGAIIGIGGEVLTGIYTWKTDETLSSVGTFEKTLVFTPNDTNYAPKEMTVRVTVKRRSTGGGGGIIENSSAPSSVTYMVSVTQATGGSISPNTVEVTKGKDQTFTITPEEGYQIADVLVNGESVGAVTAYTIKNVAADMTITAAFTKKDGSNDPAKDTDTAWKNPFSDVKTSDWFYDAVKYMHEKDLVAGTSGKTFSPNANVTRGMFVTILYRMENEPNTDAGSFGDVDSKMYYAKAIAWASDHDIVSGFSKDQFKPDTKITREQMALIVYRYAKAKGFDVSIHEKTTYADNAKVSDWAKDAVAYCSQIGVMTGDTKNAFHPQDTATRAQMVSVLQRILAMANEQ